MAVTSFNTSSVQASLRDLTSRMIIGNATVPFVLVMNPNPQNFRVNSRKSFSEAQTLGRFVFEHWGNRPDTIQCVGWTQRKVGTASDFASVDFQILRLQQIYKLDKERITSFVKTLDPRFLQSGSTVVNLSTGEKALKDQVTRQKIRSMRSLAQSFIVYRYTLYLGFFTSFAYSEQSERPRLYDYNFDFTVLFSSTDYIARNLLTNFSDNRLLNLGATVAKLSTTFF